MLEQTAGSSDSCCAKAGQPLRRSLGSHWLCPDSCAPEVIVSETCTRIYWVRYRDTVTSRRVQSKKIEDEAHSSAADGSLVNRLSLMMGFSVSLMRISFACREKF